MAKTLNVVAVSSLAIEARVAQGPGVSVLCSQSMELWAELEAAISRGATGIISFGIAGGLDPRLVAGDWVVASGVRCGDQVFGTDGEWAQALRAKLLNAVHAEIVGIDVLQANPADKARLRAQTAAAAVDMESHIAARVAAAHGIPFVACRTIIDAAQRRLPPAAAVGLRPDGTADVLAVMRSLWRQPRQFPDLIRTAFDAFVAERALRSGRQALGVGLGFPYAGEDERSALEQSPQALAAA